MSLSDVNGSDKFGHPKKGASLAAPGMMQLFDADWEMFLREPAS